MPLRVIGAGFGRTGTLSLKYALEKLGFSPCYHMMEVFPRPHHVAAWHAVAFGQEIDWDSMFEDFSAAVDWPAARYWRELASHFPDAKVILSLRSADSWYKSMTETIYQPMKNPARGDAPPLVKLQNEMVRKAILSDTFEDRFEDRDHAINVFHRHNQQVRDAIDPAQLLVFEARHGWEPLCNFLEVAVPAEPYPHVNDTASTQAMIQKMRAAARRPPS
ncbi:MAG TPA: sulfotransferase [Candidatus Binataceae bacterium]|nr:sulfotransferase [Candidatus Binataceae bacterium]